MNNIKFDKTFFLKSIIHYSTLEEFLGIEVAFLGYSNSGKSSVINCLTNKTKLARVSKLPGSTKTINFFHVLSDFRIVDFPGYGYSKINHISQNILKKNLFLYLKHRQCLRGIVIISDIRASLKSYDLLVLKIMKRRALPVLIILTKCDKISRQEGNFKVSSLRNKLLKLHMDITTFSFSKFNKLNLSLLINILSKWYFSYLDI